MISTATGMIVTRSVSDGSLNSDVLGQFKAQPRAILATGIILALLGLVPGAPTAPLLLVGCGLGIGGFLSDRKLTEQKAPTTSRTSTMSIPSWRWSRSRWNSATA